MDDTKTYTIYDDNDKVRVIVELTEEEYRNFRAFLNDSPNLRIELAA